MYAMQSILNSFNRFANTQRSVHFMSSLTHTNSTKSHIISGVSKKKRVPDFDCIQRYKIWNFCADINFIDVVDSFFILVQQRFAALVVR